MFDSEDYLLYGFIALFIVVIATVIGLVIHAGLFVDVIIDTCKPCLGEVRIAYKFATGPYKESGSLFTEAHTLLPHLRTIGVYYDDPDKKEASRLRYIVGLILSEGDETVNGEEKNLLKERGFEFATFPSIDHAVQTTFPFTSTLSIIFAVYKVYPALGEYIKTRRLCAHPFIEMYDNVESKIIFIGPLEKQDHFYVPEVKNEDLKEGEDEDNHSSVSWDDSASFIRNDTQEFDTDSVEDDSSVSISQISNASDSQPPKLKVDEPPVKQMPTMSNVEGTTPAKPSAGDDSDNTSSSFEEIDGEIIPPPDATSIDDGTYAV